MKKDFKNVIVGEKGEVSLLLYGEIGMGVNAEEFVTRLIELSKQYPSVTIHINSLGGSVLSGIAIFNAVRGCSNVSLNVDGVAASMAAVIALCGKPLYMCKNTRLMLHSVSGGADGNIEDMKKAIESMQSLEQTLADMIANRCKITPEEVKNRFFDGKDHWFTADEALSLGLIDGICDPWSELGDAALEIQNKKPDEIYALCCNHFTDNGKSTTDFLGRVKKIPFFSSMGEDEIITLLSVGAESDLIKSITPKYSLSLACNQGVITEEEKHEIEMVIGDDPVRLERYLANKRKNYEQRFTAKYNEFIALNANKFSGIYTGDFVKYKELAKTNWKLFQDLVSHIPEKRMITNEINDNAPDEREHWTLDDYRKKAPKALKDNPKLYWDLLEKEKENE